MPLRKESLADSLIALGALIPWWLCLILAAVSYLLLHLVANMDVPNVAGLQDIGANAVTQLFRTVATFAQYLIPGGLLIGAVLAFLKRRANARLYDRTRNGSPDKRIAKLSWRQFERLLGEAFRRQH